MREITAVTFDFWNTLMLEERGQIRGMRCAAWAGLLEEAGFAVERSQLDAALDHTWQSYLRHWNANEQFDATAAAEQAMELLGFTPPSEVRDQLIAAFADVGAKAELKPAPGAGEALAALRDGGLRIGIISDVGMTPSRALRDQLASHGLLGFFDHWSFSDEVGVFKPSPAIFEHALAGLGAQPSRAAHVGDIRRTDIAGAQAMGMLAVRYNGVEDDTDQSQPEGDLVLGALTELPPLLGV